MKCISLTKVLAELKPHTKGMWKSLVAAKKLLQYGTYCRRTEADVGLNTHEMKKKTWQNCSKIWMLIYGT